MAKTKVEKRAEVLAQNEKRVSQITEDIEMQKALLDNKEDVVKTEELIMTLSEELIELKETYPKVLLATSRPEYESMQRYHDIMRIISKTDYSLDSMCYFVINTILSLIETLRCARF